MVGHAAEEAGLRKLEPQAAEIGVRWHTLATAGHKPVVRIAVDVAVAGLGNHCIHGRREAWGSLDTAEQCRCCSHILRSIPPIGPVSTASFGGSRRRESVSAC